MVEIQTKDQGASLIEILRQAEEDGHMAQITEYQLVDVEDLIN